MCVVWYNEITHHLLKQSASEIGFVFKKGHSLQQIRQFLKNVTFSRLKLTFVQQSVNLLNVDFIETNRDRLVEIKFIGCIPPKKSPIWKRLIMECANLRSITIDYRTPIIMNSDFKYPFDFEPFHSDILLNAMREQIKHIALREFIILVSTPGDNVKERFNNCLKSVYPNLDDITYRYGVCHNYGVGGRQRRPYSYKGYPDDPLERLTLWDQEYGGMRPRRFPLMEPSMTCVDNKDREAQKESIGDANRYHKINRYYYQCDRVRRFAQAQAIAQAQAMEQNQG